MKHLVILLFLINGFIFCQEEFIKGKVIDSENQNPLNSANIILNRIGIGTTSNDLGLFELKGKIAADDTIEISYLGYYRQQIKTQQFLSSSNLVTVKLKPKIIPSQTILVTGSIGSTGITPISFAKVNRKEIEKNYTVQDIPEFLSSLPSTTFYSENGNNLGYNYLSIRGFDQRRISVSINGIPQNDPEDHNVYWLDFPDLLASTELIQVQRGSGSGVIGYPAIGGSINIITSGFSNEKSLDISASFGSHNTKKFSFSYSSGLVNNKYSFYTKLSQITSTGYRNSSWIQFNAYHITAIRYDKDFTTQINLYGGPIADGLAYTGLPKFAIKDKNLRKQNYSYWESDGNNYSYTLPRRSDEIENFSQPHFELLNEYNINENVSFNSALFLVLGKGFFDYDGSWGDTTYFRLTQQNGFQPIGNPQNALIRAMVENTQYGWIPRLNIKHTNGELLLGSEIRIHRSLHWGSISYASNLPDGINPNYHYYQYRGGNSIINSFIHETYNFNGNLNALAEIQLAYHKYKLYDEEYLNNDFEVSNLFLNPRFGINYKISDQLNLFGSFARVNREPRLKNYYDAAESSGGEVPQFEKNPDGTYNYNNPLVKPETMNDIEIGSSLRNENYIFGINLFYMIFNDEIVKNGKLDRFGQPITGNANRTIHYGIELTGDIKLNNHLEIILNSTLSKNYISKGSTYIEYSQGDKDIVYPLEIDGNRISGFPDFLINGIIRFNYDGLFTSISARYVGKYYSDNYDNKLNQYLKYYPDFIDYYDNVVDPYFETNIYFSYEFQPKEFLTSLKLFGQVNNLFNKLYASYAIGKEYFPSAERNFLAGIQIGL
jgi:iron complex outermembrane recepter protein